MKPDKFRDISSEYRLLIKTDGRYFTSTLEFLNLTENLTLASLHSDIQSSPNILRVVTNIFPPFMCNSLYIPGVHERPSTVSVWADEYFQKKI